MCSSCLHMFPLPEKLVSSSLSSAKQYIYNRRHNNPQGLHNRDGCYRAGAKVYPTWWLALGFTVSVCVSVSARVTCGTRLTHYRSSSFRVYLVRLFGLTSFTLVHGIGSGKGFTHQKDADWTIGRGPYRSCHVVSLWRRKPHGLFKTAVDRAISLSRNSMVEYHLLL